MRLSARMFPSSPGSTSGVDNQPAVRRLPARCWHVPVISVEAGDSDTAAIAETDAALTTSGTLTVTDPDTGDTITADVSAVSVGGTGGTNGVLTNTLQGYSALPRRSRAARLRGISIPTATRSTTWALQRRLC